MREGSVMSFPQNEHHGFQPSEAMPQVEDARSHSLSRGSALHSDEPFHCNFEGCGKIFKDKKVLRKHMMTHQPRRFHCPYPGCGKSFYERAKLKRHNLVHSGEKKFVCNFPGCQKRFALKANLQTHYRVHTGTRPFACPFPGCSKRFSQTSGRNSHYKTHLKKGKRKLGNNESTNDDQQMLMMMIQNHSSLMSDSDGNVWPNKAEANRFSHHDSVDSNKTATTCSSSSSSSSSVNRLLSTFPSDQSSHSCGESCCPQSSPPPSFLRQKSSSSLGSMASDVGSVLAGNSPQSSRESLQQVSKQQQIGQGGREIPSLLQLLASASEVTASDPPCSTASPRTSKTAAAGALTELRNQRYSGSPTFMASPTSGSGGSSPLSPRLDQGLEIPQWMAQMSEKGSTDPPRFFLSFQHEPQKLPQQRRQSAVLVSRTSDETESSSSPVANVEINLGKSPSSTPFLHFLNVDSAGQLTSTSSSSSTSPESRVDPRVISTKMVGTSQQGSNVSLENILASIQTTSPVSVRTASSSFSRGVGQQSPRVGASLDLGHLLLNQSNADMDDAARFRKL